MYRNLIDLSKFRTRVLSATLCGQTLMTDMVGGSRHVVPPVCLCVVWVFVPVHVRVYLYLSASAHVHTLCCVL
jgi:hypothetical protein